MNALDHNRYTDAWRLFGAAIPRPRAILVVSAHWYINASAVTSMGTPRTIHDFYGFPDELFAIDYPAPGDAQLAGEVAELAKPTWVGMDMDSWGLDHGAWSVLVHAFPEAATPVVELSINGAKSFDQHMALGAALAPLREDGVLILCSGNVVHNLHHIDWSKPDTGFDWAQSFDDEVAEIMTSTPGRLGRVQEHTNYKLAAPTPEHFIPLLYLAGLASVAADTAHVLVDGYAMGSLSMTSYTLGCHELEVSGHRGSPTLPELPADETNL